LRNKDKVEESCPINDQEKEDQFKKSPWISLEEGRWVSPKQPFAETVDWPQQISDDQEKPTENYERTCGPLVKEGGRECLLGPLKKRGTRGPGK